MPDFDEYWGYEEEPEEQPRDTKIDEAREVLMADLFGKWPLEVFYGRQIEVRFEKRFFHWITTRALNELAEADMVKSETMELAGPVKVRFYWSRRNRYWKRQAEATRKLILAYRNLSTKMRQWVLEFSVAAAPPLWRAAPLASGPAPREAGGPQADTFWKGRETMI